VFGHGLTKIVMVVCAEVVHDIMDNCIRWMHFDMGREGFTQCVLIMIFVTLAVDLAGCQIKKARVMSIV